MIHVMPAIKEGNLDSRYELRKILPGGMLNRFYGEEWTRPTFLDFFFDHREMEEGAFKIQLAAH